MSIRMGAVQAPTVFDNLIAKKRGCRLRLLFVMTPFKAQREMPDRFTFVEYGARGDNDRFILEELARCRTKTAG